MLDSKSVKEIKSWYDRKNYTNKCVKQLQTTVGTDPDGIVGSNTINSVYTWQIKNNLSKDGKFGKECAIKSGIELQSNTDNKEQTNKEQAAAAPSGKGINPKPGFYKQYNYKVSPYVSKSDYNKMKNAMNGAAYSTWDITSDALKSLYNGAYKTNGGKTTIASSGCGVTSYANLKGITPTDAAEMSMKSDCRVYGKGTAAAFFSNNGGKASYSASDTLNQVASGKYAICSMGTGNWTSGDGHFVLVYGFDGSKVHISDPASTRAERQTGDKKLFINQMKYAYLF